MQIGETVVIRRGAFTGYHARVVAVYTGDVFDGAITIFGKECFIRFEKIDLVEQDPVPDTRTRTKKVQEEYRHLRHAGVPHGEAVVEAAITFGFERYDPHTETVSAPAWVRKACK